MQGVCCLRKRHRVTRRELKEGKVKRIKMETDSTNSTEVLLNDVKMDEIENKNSTEIS
jgi:hypothetical protein